MTGILQTLEPLYSELGQTLARGETVLVGQRLFVTLAGRAVISDQPPDGSAARVVRRAGPGGYVGDEVLLDRPCPLQLRALDDLRLLSVPAESLPELFRVSPEFALSLARKLRETIPPEDTSTTPISITEPTPPASTPAPAPAPERLSTARAQAAPADGASDPGDGTQTQPFPFNKEWFYIDESGCPASSTRFAYLRVHTRATHAEKRHSDFYYEYHSVNPLRYAIVICPHCRLATFHDEFENLQLRELSAVRATASERMAMPLGGELRAERDHAMAADAINLALACHRARGNEPRRAAALRHRLAWLARETGDKHAELQHLSEALTEYRRVYETNRTVSDADLVNLCYIIGDLSLRLGDAEEAIRWFTTVIRMEESKKHREVLRLTRERWQEARVMEQREQSA